MYPELFRIPWIDYPISSFGVMMAIAFLTGYWITARLMEEKGMDPEAAANLLIWVMVGGVLGSKLYFAIDMHFRTGDPFLGFFLRRDGITWYGGLIGGTLVGAIGARWLGLDIKKTMDCTAVAGAVGQSIGRLGCFLVGDDYGKPTDLPWGVAFPEGAPPVYEPVHPTQLYEILWLMPVAGFLYSRRKKSPFLFGEYLALNGAGRIVIENLRVNPVVALGLTEPQWIGIGLIVIGVGGWIYFNGRAPDAEAA